MLAQSRILAPAPVTPPVSAPSARDAVDLALLDRWQRDFPLVSRPFAHIGRAVGLDETETLARYRALIAGGAISRIGAIVAPNTVGASTLAAVAALPQEVERVAAIINAEPGVNHNYARDHAINLWFVVTARGETELAATLKRLEAALARPVRDLRLENPFHLDLGFPIGAGAAATKTVLARPDMSRLSAGDRRLLATLENGIAINARPYLKAGLAASMTQAQVLTRLERLGDAGILRRFGVILHHRSLGFAANAMVVFDIADTLVDAAGRSLALIPGVTLCYRRRRARDWPFNLYCMVHARARAEAEPIIETLRVETAAMRRDMAVLFSTRCFRQRGARFGRADLTSAVATRSPA